MRILLRLLVLTGCVESSIGLVSDGGGADSATDMGVDTGVEDAGMVCSSRPPTLICYEVGDDECLPRDPVELYDGECLVGYECEPGLSTMCSGRTPGRPPETCFRYSAAGLCEEMDEQPSPGDPCELACPEGYELGGCVTSCVTDADCTLAFAECCGPCVDDAPIVAASVEEASIFEEFCSDDPCECDLDGSFRFVTALPVCLGGACVADPLINVCRDGDRCELVNVVDEGGDHCGELLALPSDVAEKVRLRYGPDEKCDRESNLSAACVGGLCNILDNRL